MDLQLGFSNPDENTYDVIIIGGGPAGASAAIYAARADLRTLVIDKGLTAGALGITGKISNYPGVPGPITGAELVGVMREQAESFGAEFLVDKVVGIDLNSDLKMVMAGTRTLYARSVILATGSMGRTSTVPGETELLGHGVSYCATCDGAFFRDKLVAVIGNNDEALEEALFLTKFVNKIELIVPTPSLKASDALAYEASHHPKIEIRLATSLRAIEGRGQVEGVRVRARGGQEVTLPVEGVFVYLQGGQPVVDDEMQADVPGVFAVGDLLCSHVKQAVIAAADGVIAAIAAEKYLHGHKILQTDWR
jgi:thioredoxin reductase (NADPH)